MNLLLITAPYTGHIYPTLNVVRELTSRGHRVTWLTHEDRREAVEATGATFIPYGDYDMYHILPEGFARGLEIGANYDALLYDFFFYVGRVLGEQRLCKPTVRLCASIAMNYHIAQRQIGDRDGIFIPLYSRFMRTLGTKHITRHNASEVTEWVYEISECYPGFSVVYNPEWFQPERLSFDHRFAFVGPTFDTAPVTDSVLSADETVAGDAVEHTSTGTYSDLSARTVLEHILAFSNKPLVYFSLGTVAPKTAKFAIRCMHALAQEDLHVVVTCGKSYDIAQLGAVPANCQVFSFVPQRAVLEHTSVFVTHGGMGSVNEAMAAGVPMVCMPVGSDQYEDSRRVCELGMGQMLYRKTATAEQLRDAVLQTLADKSAAAKARECASKLANNNGAAKAADAIETYITNHPAYRAAQSSILSPRP